MSITMNEKLTDVSRESSEAAGTDDGADTLIRLRRIEDKLDELLEDSRAARPLLERYLKSPAAAWAGRVGKGRPR